MDTANQNVVTVNGEESPPPANHDKDRSAPAATDWGGDNVEAIHDKASQHLPRAAASGDATHAVGLDRDSQPPAPDRGPQTDRNSSSAAVGHDKTGPGGDVSPANNNNRDSAGPEQLNGEKKLTDLDPSMNSGPPRTVDAVDGPVPPDRDPARMDADAREAVGATSSHSSRSCKDSGMGTENGVHVVDLEGEDGEAGGDGEGERSELLPNHTKASQDMDSVREEEEEELERMAKGAKSVDDRAADMSQSVLDLQVKAESGADIMLAPYVRRPWLGRHSQGLKTLLPVRRNGPKDILPVTSSGCLNTCTYGWVTPIIIKIYRKGAETLKAYRLSHSDAAETQSLRMEHDWKEEVAKRGPGKASFQRVAFKAFRTRFICTFIFLIFFVFFSLLNPIFLIRSFLEYLSAGDVEVGLGLAYVVGMILCEMMRSLCMGMVWIINYQAGLRIRAGAVTLLFKKILNLKGLKDKTVGEVVNLVGNDSQRIFEAIAVGPLVVAGPVAMIAGCVYAWFYLGHWALVGCSVFVGFYPFNTFISRLTTYLRRKSIFITDKRVRMMNELLSCIKLIKMYAWEKPFARKIAKIRQEERSILEKSAMVQSISTGTAIMVPTVASALTFIAIVSSGQNLTAAEAFSFVALLNSMRFVLGVLPYGIKSLSEVKVALKRYTSILLMEEMEESVGGPPPDGTAVEVKDATLGWSAVHIETTYFTEKKQKSGNSKSISQSEPLTDNKEEERHILKDSATNAMVADSSVSATLTNITFTLKKGQLLGVCGSVGCGKSSLIQAILGRMDRLSGSISIGGSIAYVPQQAWIMNATARDNILFGFPYNEDRYNRVVEACALQADFDSMVTGDQTEIGERGINLSGGQKQRLSMARALYSDRDIYLLDDPLSAVDIHIGRHIFTNCIVGFLKGKSIIFVTHQLQYLPQCEGILFLKDGQVWEQGDHDSLMELGGEYAAIMGLYYKEHTMDMQAEDDKDNKPEVSAELSSSFKAAGIERALSISSGGSEARQRVVIERVLSHTSSISQVEELKVDPGGGQNNMDKMKGRLIKEEEVGKGSVDREVFQGYMKAAGGYCLTLLVFLVFFFSILCQNSASFFLSYWLGQESGNTTIQVGNQTMISHSVTDHPQLSTFTLIYGMIIIAVVLFVFFRAISFMKFTLRASSTMHDDVFEKILRCPMSFFDTTPLGRIVNRFSSDMDEVDVRLPMTFEVFITNILHILFSLALISYVAPWFLLALLPLVVAFFVIFRIFTGTIRDMKRMDMVSRAPLISHITASVQGFVTIHAYSKSQEFLSKFCGMLNKNSVPFAMFFIANRWLALRLDMMCVAIIGATSLIILFTSDDITPAMAGLALSSAIQMTGLFQFTMRLAIESEARFTSVQRVIEYSKTVQAEAASIVPGKRPAADWPNNGRLVFRKVQMRYRPDLPLVLKGVSFKVNPQEKIGIVGRTGSGKSSLGVVLFRLVELSGGSIHIDDLDISGMGLEDLRSKLSIIPQDPVLFVGTIRYNLDPLTQHSDEELWLALEKCHIKEAIAGLEQQLEAPVVENGENFSVGERQLLCMARALLRHSKVLILDEATAAIDTETDALVQATLKEAFWDCTMLVIAHRLNTVLSCDKILVMDDGKVTEFDRPSTLMSKAESVFRNMLEASESTLEDAEGAGSKSDQP